MKILDYLLIASGSIILIQFYRNNRLLKVKKELEYEKEGLLKRNN